MTLTSKYSFSTSVEFIFTPLQKYFLKNYFQSSITTTKYMCIIFYSSMSYIFFLEMKPFAPLSHALHYFSSLRTLLSSNHANSSHNITSPTRIIVECKKFLAQEFQIFIYTSMNKQPFSSFVNYYDIIRTIDCGKKL